MLNIDADLALVVGGYNSSNTSHLVELLEDKFKTFYISSANEFDEKSITHYNYKTKEIETDTEFLPQKEQVKIILTSGASCPDAMVDEVLDKILAYYQPSKSKEEVLMEIEKL